MLPSTIFELWLLASPLLALLVATLVLHLWTGQFRRMIALQKADAAVQVRGLEERMDIVEGELRTLRSMSGPLRARPPKPNPGSKSRSETDGLNGNRQAPSAHTGRTRLSRAELDLLVKLNQMKRSPDAAARNVAPKSHSQAASSTAALNDP